MSKKRWIDYYKNNKTTGELIKQILMRTVYHCTAYPVILFLSRIKLNINTRKIVFISDVDFTDNPRVLYDRMKELGYGKAYKMVWIVKEPEKLRARGFTSEKFIRKNTWLLPFQGIKACYNVWTSGIVFYSHSMKWAPKKDPKQKYINLWHGCGYKDTKGGSEEIVFDYFLTPSEFFIETKTRFFHRDSHYFLPLGYPRYDLLLRDNRDKVSDKIPAVGGRKTVIWMPTFRKTEHFKIADDTLKGETGLPVFYTAESLLRLDKACRDNQIFLFIKRHNYQTSYFQGTHEYQNIMFLDDMWLSDQNIQLYELISITDAMVSDYSSAAVDYLLLDKPIGFTLDDYDQYMASRGFIIDRPLEYMPGDHIYTEEDFFEFIRKIHTGTDSFKQRRQEICRLFHKYTLPGFCDRILDSFDKMAICKKPDQL